MHYWLQQLQQKRWEYSNTRGSGQRDSWSSPTLAYPATGLVGKDNGRQVHTNTHAKTWHCGHSFSRVCYITSRHQWKVKSCIWWLNIYTSWVILLPGSQVSVETACGQSQTWIKSETNKGTKINEIASTLSGVCFILTKKIKSWSALASICDCIRAEKMQLNNIYNTNALFTF